MADNLFECTGCHHSLPESAFKKKTVDGELRRTLQCKRCAKNRDCLRIWGKTFDQMEEEANYQCGLCGEPEKATWRGESTSLSIDHDHDTMEFRGLLCRACNILVGYYEKLIADDDLRMSIRKWIGGESDR